MPIEYREDPPTPWQRFKALQDPPPPASRLTRLFQRIAAIVKGISEELFPYRELEAMTMRYEKLRWEHHDLLQRYEESQMTNALHVAFQRRDEPDGGSAG